MGRLNKPAKEGYTYRSPGQTNARDTTPNLREDVMASQSADIDRIRRGLDTSSTRPQNRSQVQNAAGRAVTRTGGRAALAGAALEGGYELGKYIDEKTGLGKKMVDKSGLGDLAEEMATPSEKVELSEESKARIARGDLNEKPKAKARADKDSEGGGGGGRSEPKSRALMENREPKDEAMKRGGAVKKPQYMSFSKTGKPAGMRNVTKMASGGVTASRRADGIAQRGKTRGKMC
jgi:hypothetical protein